VTGARLKDINDVFDRMKRGQPSLSAVVATTPVVPAGTVAPAWTAATATQAPTANPAAEIATGGSAGQQPPSGARLRVDVPARAPAHRTCCAAGSVNWADLGITAFQMWLRIAVDAVPSPVAASVGWPWHTAARSDNHINLITYAVCEMFKFAAAEGVWERHG